MTITTFFRKFFGTRPSSGQPGKAQGWPRLPVTSAVTGPVTDLLPFRPGGGRSSPEDGQDFRLVAAQWHLHAASCPGLTWPQFLDRLARRERHYAARCEELRRELNTLKELPHL